MGRMGKRLVIGMVVLVIGALLLSLGTYVVAYHGMGERDDMIFYDIDIPRTNRIYSSEWRCKLFAPAAWVESKLSNKQVNLWFDDEGIGSCVYSAG